MEGKGNGIGVILEEEYTINVLEVKRELVRLMCLKVETEREMLNVGSNYGEGNRGDEEVMGRFGLMIETWKNRQW